MWQPTASRGCSNAMWTAGEKYGAVAIKVVDVRAPAFSSSTMARLTPGARPKSSALIIRRLIFASVPRAHFAFSNIQDHVPIHPELEELFIRPSGRQRYN